MEVTGDGTLVEIWAASGPVAGGGLSRSKSGIVSAFEALEGWPKDYATNPSSIVKFFREHQCPSFLEYSEHPYVSCEQIKKALTLKATFSNILDLMQ